MQEIKPLALGLALVALAAMLMLLSGLSGNSGVYTSPVEMLSRWNMFFSFSFAVIIAGMLEAVIIYNRLI
ncbi:hypothetical protein [Methanohalophilus halophilus]|nr:hypothetical protein [Methanohalophilus halophilus]SDW98055.1 hypothetical protein SAMN04515625_2004 [Methanohalophilus halophilus]